ncbi:MAG: RNA 2',3'-cyclic phosphodiesterase [Bacteroidales bacterium]|nr:RNA 2',3'-cyclic phosphodiesterase [Bacteroidales bacterium]
MPRCFMALPVTLTNEIHNLYLKAAKLLQDEKIKYSEVGNLHVTIHFFGEIEQDEIQVLIKNFDECLNNMKQINSYIEGYFVFGLPRKPSVIGIKLNYNLEFELLVNKCRKIIKSLNYEIDKRLFVPHVTFGRVKQHFDINKYHKLLAQQIDHYPVVLQDLFLYKSTLTHDGPIYEKIWSIKLV